MPAASASAGKVMRKLEVFSRSRAGKASTSFIYDECVLIKEMQMNEQKVAHSGLVELTAAEIAEVQGGYFLLYWLLCTPAH